LAARELREKLIQMAITDARSPVRDTGDVVIEAGRIRGLRQPAKSEAIEAQVARSGRRLAGGSIRFFLVIKPIVYPRGEFNGLNIG
jgi:hypothetical protein